MPYDLRVAGIDGTFEKGEFEVANLACVKEPMMRFNQPLARGDYAVLAYGGEGRIKFTTFEDRPDLAMNIPPDLAIDAGGSQIGGACAVGTPRTGHDPSALAFASLALALLYRRWRAATRRGRASCCPGA